MTPLLNDFISKSEELLGWIDNYFGSIEIPPGVRYQLAMTCFYIAVDHHRSILFLVNSGRYGSAFTLSRTVLDSCVRGLWLYSHASDNDIEHIVEKRTFNKDFKKMVEIVESKNRGLGQDKIIILQHQLWPRLSGYTHTGLEQITRYIADEEIKPNFKEEEVLQMVDFVNVYNLSTAYRMSSNLGAASSNVEFGERAVSYANYSERILNSLK